VSKTAYVYGILEPIDCTIGALTLSEYIQSVNMKSEWESNLCQDSLIMLYEGKKAARGLGWQGDVIEGIYVFALPVPCEVGIGFWWKQSCNGYCFVVSPQKLPWLSNDYFTKTEIDYGY
jgi:hypothetical protein